MPKDRLLQLTVPLLVAKIPLYNQIRRMFGKCDLYFHFHVHLVKWFIYLFL